MIRALVLIGLPGAGKSTTGAVLAQRLGWQFHDVDDVIISATGRSVSDLFHQDGETAFRAMEARLTVELSSRSDVVVAPGGGWAAQPFALENLPPHAAAVWLRVAPEEAIARLRGSSVARPLLAVADPLSAIRTLAGERNHRYAQAALTIDVDGMPAVAVAENIIEWLKRSTS